MLNKGPCIFILNGNLDNYVEYIADPGLKTQGKSGGSQISIWGKLQSKKLVGSESCTTGPEATLE